MSHLYQFLNPASIELFLSAREESLAVKEVITLLENHPSVTNWPEFCESVLTRSTFPLSVDADNAVMIYHGRTDSVRDLVMSVGRSQEGIRFQQSEQLVRLIIVVGIPHALSNEYLRMMGSLARVVKEPLILQKLMLTDNVTEFITTLSLESEE